MARTATSTRPTDRPLKVWQYRGWNVVCRICNCAVTVDGQVGQVDHGSRQVATTAGLEHLRAIHTISGLHCPRCGTEDPADWSQEHCGPGLWCYRCEGPDGERGPEIVDGCSTECEH